MVREEVDNVEDVVGYVFSLMFDWLEKSEMRLSPAINDARLLCDSSIVKIVTIFSDSKAALLTTSASRRTSLGGFIILFFCTLPETCCNECLRFNLGN